MNYVKIASLICITLFNTLQAFTQFKKGNTFSIHGRVVNEFGEGLDGVSVLLHNAKDSELVKINISSKEGGYAFNKIFSGNYYISFSAIGFTNVNSKTITVDSSEITLDNIALQKTRKLLSGIVVTAQKPVFENKSGKLIMNVEGSPILSGSNALTLIEKIPGVVIDADQIDLNGRGSAFILIDERPIYVSGNSLAIFLKNIPSADIDQMEILYTPSARYDANGTGGVINIKTKKNKQYGLNGTSNISYSQGKYPKGTATFGVNYRNPKFNFLSSCNINYGTYYHFISMVDEFRDFISSRGFRHRNTTNTNPTNDNSIKLGLDYHINSKHSIGGTFLWQLGTGSSKTLNDNRLSDNQSEVYETLKTNSLITTQDYNLSSNVNYKGVLDTNKTELNVDLDYVRYSNYNDQKISAESYDVNGILNGPVSWLSSRAPSNSNIYAGKISLQIFPKKNLNIEFGGKGSYIKSDNGLDYYRLQNAEWIKDNNLSKHFIYQEVIGAGYATITKKINSVLLELGIRAEQSNLKGHELKSDTVIQRKYFNVFPSITVTKYLNEKNSINVSYNRRIQRPNYADLNPFIALYDSLSTNRGNPYLRPAFIDNIECGYNYHDVSVKFNYSYTKDITIYAYRQNLANKSSTFIKENVNHTSVGFSISAPVTIKKWWKTYVYGYVYYTHRYGYLESDLYNLRITTSMIKLSNKFTINPTCNAEIAAMYKSRWPTITALFLVDPIYSIDAGVSKQLFNKKITATLQFQMALYWQKLNFSYGLISSNTVRHFDSNRIGISFNYNFGKRTVTKIKEHTSGAVEEEKNRL